MENDRYDVAKIVVLSGWALTLLMCFIIVGAAAYSLIVHRTIEVALKDFATLCLGFMFGSVVSLVKDFIKLT